MTQVLLTPAASITAAVAADPAGTTFVLSSGTYFDQEVTPKNNDAFIGQAGTVLDGSIPLHGWHQSGALWAHVGMPAGLAASGEGANGNTVATLPEDLFVNG